MKAIQAIKILEMMDDNTEVELIFPDAVKEVNKPRKPQLTEGAMAALPMRPVPRVTYAAEDGYPIYHSMDDTFMSGRWKD